MNFERETLFKIRRNKAKIEKKLDVKIVLRKNDVELKGREDEVYAAERVFLALERNFSIDSALLLANEEYLLEDIYIKSITKRRNTKLVKARIIGKDGSTLRLLSELSNCEIVLHENVVSIIGNFDRIKIATNAITSLIQGSKQANVYAYLEKARRIKRDDEIEELKKPL